MTNVERFTPNPEHGRPMIARFSGPEGALAVHCNREDGALWLFAAGPKGGSRGSAVWGVGRARHVLAWLDANDRSLLSGGLGYIRWFSRTAADGGALLTLDQEGMRRGLGIQMDAAAVSEFKNCMREWATAALRLSE